MLLFAILAGLAGYCAGVLLPQGGLGHQFTRGGWGLNALLPDECRVGA